jgi:predicted ATPase
MELLTPLDIAPSSMRDFSRKGRYLNLDARNISGVLAELCEEADEKRILVDWLSELCAPELSDIDFIEVKELGDFMAVLVEKSGARISARSLSDGTLRFLGLLVALRAAEPGDVFLIEEIDAGLHPTRVRVLVEFLVDVAHRKGVQVIATTHSPVVLEWLKSFSEAALRSAVVFGRIPEHEGTVMRCLGDLPHFDEIVARKRIDELFSTGWLERAL